MPIVQNELKSLLIASNKVTFEQYSSAEKISRHLNIPVADVLIGRRIIAESEFGEILAKSYDTPFIDLKKIDIPDSLTTIIPEDMVISRRVVPFDRSENKLLVAMEDPTNLETIEFVRKTTGLEIIPYLATTQGIRHGLRYFHKGIKEFVRILKEDLSSTQLGSGNVQKLAQDISVIRIVDNIVEYAIAEEASDIHIEGLTTGVLIRYRIDGVLHDIITLPRTLHSAVVARIKILSDLKLDETRLAQDGRFRFKTKEGEVISLRVSILPTVEGEKVVLRILESVLQRFNLEELGFAGNDEKIVKSAISRPHGLMLVTGPTGSGKTTTLYTILGLLNIPEVNISTVEDPVENRIPRVNQTQINPLINFTFADGLRALLRQDPNIIMVGEIRDRETASIAVNAAMTGHLVLSTLHTNDSAGAIPRMIDLGVEPFLIASTLNLIMAQRLVRIICTVCKATYPLPAELNTVIAQLLRQEGHQEDKIAQLIPKQVYKGEGCSHCDYTGFKGRFGIYELLIIDDKIRPLIIQKNSADTIKQLALTRGMRTMLADGLIKVIGGFTTIHEVLRVTTE